MAADDVEHQFDQIVVAGADTKSVHAQEGKTGGERDPLVAVEEGMVADQVEQVSGGLFLERGVEELVTHGRFRHRE